MCKRSWLQAGSVLAMAVGANLWAGMAVAQSEEDAEVSEVIVTGSFIPGTPEDAAIPVEAITFEEIRNQGSPSNMDLIKTMTEIGSVQGETNRNNALPVGAGSINLRSLSSARTVVLFNNRRWGEQFGFTIGRFNDTSQIPNAVVGRVEIVKDGGNAIYGADAVGGVVNYISRKNFTGLEVNASYRAIEGSAGGDYDTSILWGKSWDNGNVIGAINYIKRNTLHTTDRDFALGEYLENPSAIGFTWSTSGSPGSYFTQSRRTGGNPNVVGSGTPSAGYQTIGLGRTGINQYLVGAANPNAVQIGGAVVRDAACSELGGFSGWGISPVAPTPVCYYHTAQFDTLVEENETFSVYAEGNYEFAPWLKFHGEAYYYWNQLPKIVVNPSDALGSYPIGLDGCSVGATSTGACSPGSEQGYSVPGTNPAVLGFLQTSGYTPAQIAAVTDPANPGRVFLAGRRWRPFGMGGNPLTGGADFQKNSRDVYRVVGEFSGDLGNVAGWDLAYRTSGTYQYVRYQISTRDMLVDRLQAALKGFGGPNCTGTVAGAGGCMWFNPFSSAIERNVVTGEANNLTYNAALANSPALVEWLYVPIALDRRTDLVVFDFLLNGSGGINLWGGPVAFALGAQYRRVKETNDVTEFTTLGRNLFNGTNTGSANPCPTLGVTNCPSFTGPIVFRRAVGGIRRDYTRKYPVKAAFAEVSLPIFDNFSAAAAVRYERFESDITDAVDDVWVGSGSLKWQVTPNIALRATGGNTFSSYGGDEEDVVRTANATTASFPDFDISGATLLSSAPPTLKSEGGFNYNVGAIFNVGNFRGTIDYYHIKITDVIVGFNSNALVAGLVGPGQSGSTATIDCSSSLLVNDPRFAGPQVKLAGFTSGDQQAYCNGLADKSVGANLGTGSELRYYNRANGGDQTTSGIDAGASYRFNDVWDGTLTVSSDVSYILTYDVKPFIVNDVVIAEGYSGLGQFNEATGRNGQHIARWRGNISFNFSRGRHNINWSTRVVSSMIDDSTTRYTASFSQNANIGNAAGATSTALCPSGGLILQEGEIPAGAGTGTTGTSTTGSGTTAQFGYVAACNAQLLGGRKIPTTFNTDVTYRVSLPWDVSLAFTVYNLFDKDPEFSRCNSCGYSYDPFTGNPLGRNFKLSVTKRF